MPVMMIRLSVITLWMAVLLLWSGPVLAAPLPHDQVPDPLKPWISWALHGKKGWSCPALHNDSSRDASHTLCYWPGRLQLELKPSGGSFTQEWRVWEQGWVTLPGDERHWPQEVYLNQQPTTVVAREGKPALLLRPGSHQVRGEWSWQRLPDMMTLPATVGLLQLAVDGQEVAAPHLDRQGRLWLRTKEQPQAEEDHLTLSVQRKVSDGIPLMVTTRMELDVSGRQRELLLQQPLQQGLIPVSLHAPIPVALEQDGSLRVQARPGHWVIELLQRHDGPAQQLSLQPSNQPEWPNQEVWAFEAQNQLRLVTVTGVAAIDPQQTTLPKGWQGLPVYLVRPGETMLLQQRQRGNSDPAPDRLQMKRSWWLDFDGQGWTLRDEINGLVNHPDRLEMATPTELGRVALHGRDQLITQQAGSPRSGIELRRGEIALVAEGRLTGDRSILPAVGWRHDLQGLSGQINLPPGWRLWYADGVDRVSSSWIHQWSLLDLFLVLVVALAMGRMWRRRWLLVAIPALVLIHHEQPSISWIVLHLLIATALLRVVPSGWPHRWSSWYRWSSLMALALTAVPFMVSQAHLALHPQLEQGGHTIYTAPALSSATPSSSPSSSNELQQADVLQEKQESDAPRVAKRALPLAAGTYASAPAPQQASLGEIDRHARIQTGPGLPQWRWHTVSLTWNGPVTMDQELRLWLTPPWLNRILAVARMLLLLALLPLFLDQLPWQQWRRSLAVAMLMPLLLTASEATATPTDAIPTDAMLEELSQRLTAAPDCLPHCADISRMELTLTSNRMRLRLEIHTSAAVAIPLPGGVQHWLPTTVAVHGQPSTNLMRHNDSLLLALEQPGRHQVTLEGMLPPARDTVQLPLPLLPHRVVVQSGGGWQIAGINSEGIPDKTLLLQRPAPIAKTAPQDGHAAAWPAAQLPPPLPPLLQVERQLMLGLGQEWRVRTVVRRLSPAGHAVAGHAVLVALPLLAGESVTTPGLSVVQGRLSLNMAAGVHESSWESILAPTEELLMQAAPGQTWYETWKLEAHPVWHVEAQGVPMLSPAAAGHDRWAMQWRPWPGETLQLRISRPAAVEGTTLTLERSELTITPGLRTSTITLKLSVRSSRGDQHRITLPEGASLLGVSINGVSQPISQEGQQVTCPIVPGLQELLFSWQQPLSISSLLTTPSIDLGLPGVNHHLHLNMPRDRWLLWSQGPLMGPAVLFWGALMVVLAVAIGLGRLRWTPLTTRHWLLLGMGLIPVSAWSALVVVGWFLVLGWRRLHPPTDQTWWRFNLTQLGLFCWTLMAASALLAAIQHGLLGYPDMQVTGNGSSLFQLHWYQDRHDALLPQGTVLTLPLLGYRLLMLIWSLWLATSVVTWTQWGWGCLSQGQLWLPRPPKIGPGAA
ncbi:MAG: hypothetical protein HQL58_03615 [Magnetococcales bacterium]|nr:hypothetical protein [Magnetococcales bacterium]